MSLAAAIVDAFTTTPGQGNRAGVVTKAEGLDDAAMQAAATAVAASETAFLFPGPRLKFFTPAEEIPFCGHATVATIHYLVETGVLAAPDRIDVQCKAGPLKIEIDAARTVWIDSGTVEWEECGKRLEESAMEWLGASASARDTSLPILKSRGKLFVPMSRRKDLWSVQPRWEAIASLHADLGIMGLYAFTLEVMEPGSVSHGRFFAPAVGIREDPVTGSASVPLAHYLARSGILKLPKEGGVVRARAEQGDAMGKAGRVELEVTGAPGNIRNVRIGGRAVTVMEGTLR